MARYFVFRADTPYCGTDNYEYVEYPDDVTDEEIEDDCENFGMSNAESFEYLATGWDIDEPDNYEDYDEAIENYYADCQWSFYSITEEEYLKNTAREE